MIPRRHQNVAQFLVHRRSLADRLPRGQAARSPNSPQTYNVKNVRAYSDMYDDAIKMMKSEELKAFDLDAEPEQTA
jgi:hypothetical protein